MWELHEVVRNTSSYARASLMEHMRDGGSPTPPLLLGLYSSPELARAAMSTRLQPLFGGGDCFTTPCHEKLEMQQRWNADGSGEVVVSMKKPAEVALAYQYAYDDVLVFTVALSDTVVDQPPRDEQECAYGWHDFLAIIRPPPPPLTAEEQAAKTAARLAAAIKLRLETYLPGC